MRAPEKAVVGHGASPNLKNLLNLRPPAVLRAGDDPQVFRHHQDLAAMGVTAENKQIAHVM